MSNQITEGFVNQFKNVVKLLLQQSGSKMRKSVMEQQCYGEGAKILEQVGSVTPRLRTVRHAPSPQMDTPQSARWVYPVGDYDWGDFIDVPDKVKTIVNFDSPYADAARKALGRGIDDQIFTGALGTNNIGKNGSSTEAFTGQTVTTAGGLTVAKLREARLKLMEAEVDVENEKLWFVCRAKQHDNLLADALAISQDFTDRPRLEDGMIRSFLGFEFIVTERVPLNGSSRARCLAYPTSGLALGVWNDINVKVSERADMSYSTYVYAQMIVGATRTELKKVVEVECT